MLRNPQLQARMRATMGPAYDRVIFYPRLPNSDTFMSFISVADVLLHPFPFDGSKTAADGLAMGIPVVTWPSVRLCCGDDRADLYSMRSMSVL